MLGSSKRILLPYHRCPFDHPSPGQEEKKAAFGLRKGGTVFTSRPPSLEANGIDALMRLAVITPQLYPWVCFTYCGTSAVRLEYSPDCIGTMAV